MLLDGRRNSFSCGWGREGGLVSGFGTGLEAERGRRHTQGHRLGPNTFRGILRE